MKKEKYTAKQVAKELGMEYIKVYKRFTSKYANERWGVVKIKLRDGRNKLYLPKENMNLWIEDNPYIGRPTTI